MQRVLYRIAWIFIYLIYSFVHFVKRISLILHRKYADYYKSARMEDDLKVITRAVKQIDKIPTHMLFLVGNENLSIKDLGNVVIWCIAAGVSFLSFYDLEGELKKQEAQFCDVVSEMHKKYSANIIWGKIHQTNGVPSLNGTKNGFEFLRKVRVNVGSSTDGKGSIVNVTHQLCQSVKEYAIKACDITQDIIDRRIQDHSGVPDPDVAIVCGSLCCIYGLSPWQIRVTEFIQVSSHHNLTAEDFIGVLHKYNKCEQRFGK